MNASNFLELTMYNKYDKYIHAVANLEEVEKAVITEHHNVQNVTSQDYNTNDKRRKNCESTAC